MKSSQSLILKISFFKTKATLKKKKINIQIKSFLKYVTIMPQDRSCFLLCC